MRRDRKIKVFFAILTYASLLGANEELQDKMILKLLNTSKSTESLVKELRVQLYLTEENVLKLQKKIEKIEHPPINPFVVPVPKEESGINSQIIKKCTQNESYKFIVIAWSLNIREKPTMQSKKIGMLSIGTILETKEVSDGWAKAGNGYVSTYYLKNINNTEYIKANVAINKTRIRKLPSLKSEIIEIKNINEEISILPYVFYGRWYKVKGENGFIYKSNVKVVNH